MTIDPKSLVEVEGDRLSELAENAQPRDPQPETKKGEMTDEQFIELMRRSAGMRRLNYVLQRKDFDRLFSLAEASLAKNAPPQEPAAESVVESVVEESAEDDDERFAEQLADGDEDSALGELDAELNGSDEADQA